MLPDGLGILIYLLSYAGPELLPVAVDGPRPVVLRFRFPLHGYRS